MPTQKTGARTYPTLTRAEADAWRDLHRQLAKTRTLHDAKDIAAQAAPPHAKRFYAHLRSFVRTLKPPRHGTRSEQYVYGKLRLRFAVTKGRQHQTAGGQAMRDEDARRHFLSNRGYAAHPSSRRSPALAAMTNKALQLEQSVEAEVSLSFAWRWRTDVENWVDPPAEFQLDGPFASGSWGTTHFPGQEPMRWQIRDVRPTTAFIIDMPLDGAVLSFEWTFEPLSGHRTRITQRIVLSGDNAIEYADRVRSGFGSTLDDGMRRIADALVRAERSMQRRDPGKADYGSSAQ
jgi:hypothetical protein